MKKTIIVSSIIVSLAAVVLSIYPPTVSSAGPVSVNKETKQPALISKLETLALVMKLNDEKKHELEVINNHLKQK